jgi:SAM-dependent methyltransferase
VPAAGTLIQPNPARAYGYLLGSRDNFEADRQAIRNVEDAYGPEGSEARGLPRAMAAANRGFLTRAVAWAAENDVGQFLDLGCGFPVTGPFQNIHEAAPGARVCYVDRDPTVIRHSRLQFHGEGLACALADLRDPGAVLRHPEVTSILDLGEPAGLILGMVAHLMRAGRAAAVVEEYVSAMAPGSVVILSSARWDDRALWERVRDAYPLTVLINHTPDDLAAILGGLDLVPPGIAPAGAWRPGWADCPGTDAPAYILGAAGRKA